MYKFVALSLLVAAAAAVPTPDTGLDCLRSEDLVSCFAVKASAAISRASRSAELQLIDGVSFVRETPVERSGKSMPQSEKELMAELPAEAAERALKVSSMIYDAAVNFFKSHSLKVNPDNVVARTFDALSEDDDEDETETEEDEKEEEEDVKTVHKLHKKGIKKYLPMLYSLAGVKFFALAPILLGGLALLVLKAILVGKVALLIAGVLAFQKYFGGNSLTSLFAPKTATPTWSDPAIQTYPAPAGTQTQAWGSYPQKRSFEQDAHNLAYSAHAPATASS